MNSFYEWWAKRGRGITSGWPRKRAARLVWSAATREQRMPMPCGHPTASTVVGDAIAPRQHTHCCGWCADVSRLCEYQEALMDMVNQHCPQDDGGIEDEAISTNEQILELLIRDGLAHRLPGKLIRYKLDWEALQLPEDADAP